MSASQLLFDANNQGIPVVTISSANSQLWLPQLEVSDDVINDIENALARGMIAIAPMVELQKGMWSGSGYILLDPETGFGAYLIDGGLNGAELDGCDVSTSPLVEFIQAILIAAIIILLIAAIISSGGAAAGGLAAPGAAQALRMTLVVGLGMGASTAYADEKCQYNVRIQAQGGGYEDSEPYSDIVPMTVAEAIQRIDLLAAKMPAREYEKRTRAIASAKAWLVNRPSNGGVPPSKKSFYQEPTNPRNDNRIDIEVWRGVNFKN